MSLQHLKQRLIEKERELLTDLARFENEARGSREAEVEDEIDEAVSSESKSTLFEESNIEWQALTLVRNALGRIDDGTYGTCLECGRAIEPARLKAVPWAAYCLADQQKHDEAAIQEGSRTR